MEEKGDVMGDSPGIYLPGSKGFALRILEQDSILSD